MPGNQGGLSVDFMRVLWYNNREHKTLRSVCRLAAKLALSKKEWD